MYIKPFFMRIIASGDDFMKRKKNDIPVPEPDKNEEYLCPSASWGDMTGLIPYNAAEDTSESSCREAYPYLSGCEGRKEEKS